MRIVIPPNLPITADDLYKRIRQLAKIDNKTSNVIADFSEVTFTNPRGRYGIELFATYFKMQSSSYDYKIMFQHIQHFIMLPKPDLNAVEFVLSLTQAVRQGKQEYHHLVIQLSTSKTEMVTGRCSSIPYSLIP